MNLGTNLKRDARDAVSRYGRIQRCKGIWHVALIMKHARPQHKAKRKCSVPASQAEKHDCPKCDKSFESWQALDYHYSSNPWFMVRPLLLV